MKTDLATAGLPQTRDDGSEPLVIIKKEFRQSVCFLLFPVFDRLCFSCVVSQDFWEVISSSSSSDGEEAASEDPNDGNGGNANQALQQLVGDVISCEICAAKSDTASKSIDNLCSLG